jgi:predicted O-methyltransferase YrrM
MQYLTARATMNPFDFLSSISKFKNINSIKSLDYSKIISHNFFSQNDDVDHNWISEPEVGRFIGDLVFNLDAKKVVETGCFVGFGSSHLATALCSLGSGRDFYVVDLNKRFLDIAKNNMSLLGLDKISYHFLEGRSWDKNVLDIIPGDIDVMFLDSDHSYEGTKTELDCYLPKLSTNGVAIMHDTILWPGVRKVVGELAERYSIMTFATSRGSGLSLILKRK